MDMALANCWCWLLPEYLDARDGDAAQPPSSASFVTLILKTPRINAISKHKHTYDRNIACLLANGAGHGMALLARMMLVLMLEISYQLYPVSK